MRLGVGVTVDAENAESVAPGAGGRVEKLIVAVLPNALAGGAVDALVAAGCGVTRIASTGGFLRQGNTTLLAGVSATALEGALAAVRGACRAGSRETAGRTTLLVLNVVAAERL